MKLSVSMGSFTREFQQGKMDVFQFMKRCKELDIDGIEFMDSLWKNKAKEMPEVQKFLKEQNLLVSAYAINNDMVMETTQQRTEQIEIIKKGVDDAVALGAKVVRIYAGDSRNGLTLERCFDYIVGGLIAGARYAEKKGILLALENHGQLAGRGDQIRKIIDEVGSDALQANINTGNFLLVNQNPADAVRGVVALAVAVTLKDFKKVADDYDGILFEALNGEKFAGAVIGEGCVNLSKILMFLKGVGYNGYLSIEYEGDEDTMTAVTRSVENARKLMAKTGCC